MSVSDAGLEVATATNDGASDAAGCVSHTYGEGLSTTLRGIQLGGGYYRFREFRDGALAPAVVIERERAYGACASGGGSSLPDRCFAWVFTTFAINTYTSIARTIDATDAAGNRLELSMTYNNALSCYDIDYVRVDGVAVTMTAQTFPTGVLSTCGVASEPAFTTPPVTCGP